MTLEVDSNKEKLSQASADDWARRLFERIDASDTDGWLEFLSSDARFCFGNSPPLAGREAIRDGVNAFLSALGSVKHEIAEVWNLSDAVICRGVVTYTLKDGSTLSIPFANVFKLKDDGLVREYQIYADTSEL